MSQELSEVFYSFLISSCVGLLLVLIKTCYKSKCREVDVCCIKIIRDVEGETTVDVEQSHNNNNNRGEDNV
jgi:hypothetical protein